MSRVRVGLATLGVVGAFLGAGACGLQEAGLLPTSDAGIDVTVDVPTVRDASPDVDAEPADADAAPPFSPTSLAGLELWLTAEGIQQDGGTVSAWVDRSGKSDPARNASPTSFLAPTIVDAGFGPAVYFGPGSGLRTSIWDAGLTDPITIFAIVNRTPNLALATYIIDNASLPDHSLAILSNRIYVAAGKLGPSVALPPTPMSLIGEFNGPSSFILESTNSFDGGTMDPGNNKPVPGFTIGNYSGGSYSFQGWIAEIAVYSRALPPNEIAALNQYAAEHYAITIK